MRFGILLIVPSASADARRELAEAVEQAVRAEELGYDSVWVTEHHSAYGQIGSPAVLLAAIATRTSRVRLDSLVTVLPAHDPLRVAEDYALVDVLSGGRLELGVGRGNLRAELAQFDVDEGTSRDELWRRLEIVRAAWGDLPGSSPSSFPRPLQRPVPIWVAANSIESGEKAASLGLRIALSPGPDDLDSLEARARALAGALARHGRSPAEAEFPLLSS
jgi:alkanesulfonate monooxygenase SsuD/methylene tetrahydromethanopterin reductase-like flavin-dependent oxidoreductase (luciferase family)